MINAVNATTLPYILKISRTNVGAFSSLSPSTGISSPRYPAITVAIAPMANIKRHVNIIHLLMLSSSLRIFSSFCISERNHYVYRSDSKNAESYALAALTIAVNLSVLREAPPIRPPSTFSLARSSAALASFIEPPY